MGLNIFTCDMLLACGYNRRPIEPARLLYRVSNVLLITLCILLTLLLEKM